MIRVTFWLSLVLSCALLIRFTVFSGLGERLKHIQTERQNGWDVDERTRGGVTGQLLAMYQQLLGSYIKNIHYGGMDGVVTTFSVVAGVEGAQLAPRVTLALGFASLFADALSMGVGEYVSAAAEMEYDSTHPVSCTLDIRKEQMRQALLADQVGSTQCVCHAD